MKKIILLILILFTFVSCGCYEKDHISTITYTVHYPNKSSTKTYSFESSNEPSYSLNSSRGTNNLVVYEDSSWPGHGMKHLEQTSAPIEVISFIKRKK